MSKNGFLYATDSEREREFALAEYFFNKYPQLVKISRKNWHTLSNANDQKKLTELGFDSKNLPKHSYFRQYDEHHNELVVAFARGKGHQGLLGAGAFGRVKYAEDKAGKLYAMKVEKKEYKSRETEIAQDVGLMKGDKTTVKKSATSKKYYSLFEYMGIGLEKKLQQNSFSYTERIRIAKKTAWVVHQLHSGYLSATSTQYAHHDLKPENIVLDDRNSPKLIDYGFARLLTEMGSTAGTVIYTPLTFQELLEGVREKKYPSLGPILKTITPVAKDTFALKRIFYLGEINGVDLVGLFSNNEFGQFPQKLKESLDTKVIETALKQNDTPLTLALSFLSLEYGKKLDEILKLSPRHQDSLYQCLDILEFFEENITDMQAIQWKSLKEQIFSIKNENQIICMSNDLLKCKNEFITLNQSSRIETVNHLFATYEKINMDILNIRKRIAEYDIDPALFAQDLYSLSLLNNVDDILKKVTEIASELERAINDQYFEDSIDVLSENIKECKTLFLNSNDQANIEKYKYFEKEIKSFHHVSTQDKGQLDEKIVHLNALTMDFYKVKHELLNLRQSELVLMLYQHLKQANPLLPWNKKFRNAILSRIEEDMLQPGKINVLNMPYLTGIINKKEVMNLLTTAQQKSIKGYIIEHDIPNLDVWKKPIGLKERMALFISMSFPGLQVIFKVKERLNPTVKEDNQNEIPFKSSTATVLKAFEAEKVKDDDLTYSLSFNSGSNSTLDEPSKDSPDSLIFNDLNEESESVKNSDTPSARSP